jgi:hypothetical protein
VLRKPSTREALVRSTSNGTNETSRHGGKGNDLILGYRIKSGKTECYRVRDNREVKTEIPIKMSLWERWPKHPQRLSLRKALLQVHLWTGVVFSLHASSMRVSGTVLIYRVEIGRAVSHHPIIPLSDGGNAAAGHSRSVVLSPHRCNKLSASPQSSSVNMFISHNNIASDLLYQEHQKEKRIDHNDRVPWSDYPPHCSHTPGYWR